MLYESPDVLAMTRGDTAYLLYRAGQSAGAVGMSQGEALLSALMDIEDAECAALVIGINSAGAHFEEPMQGLFYLNNWIETLHAFKRKGLYLTVVSDGSLYGGAAMAMAACADAIRLGPDARMGLLGPKVSGVTDDALLPTEFPGVLRLLAGEPLLP